jgi:hypothetical protein
VTPGGLGVCVVRLNPAGDGPRIGAKLVRWGRVQVGEVDIETQQAHRMLTVQLEGQVLKGVDAEADRVSRFVQAVLAAVDGRPIPSLDEPRARGRSASSAARAGAGSRAGKAAAASKGVGRGRGSATGTRGASVTTRRSTSSTPPGG